MVDASLDEPDLTSEADNVLDDLSEFDRSEVDLSETVVVLADPLELVVVPADLVAGEHGVTLASRFVA